MATFFEGSRGSGKSKYAIKEIQEHLNSGRPVATNLDLFLDKLCPDNNKAHYVRLPDYPRSSDLWGLGTAYPELDHDKSETYDSKKFGLVVLDELLTSFNSRNWNDPDRLEVINWIVQSRKDAWNLRLIGQSVGAVDKQIVTTVIDELYSFRNSKNLFNGVFWRAFIKPWFTKICPEFHVARMYDGLKKDKTHFMGVDWFQRVDLHNCYKTAQQFKKDVKLIVVPSSKKPIEVDLRATYTVLHPKYFDDNQIENTENTEKTGNSGNSGNSGNNEVDKNTKKKDFKPIPTWKLTLLFMALFGFIWFYDFSDNNDNTQNKATKSSTKKINKSNINNLGEIYINCSEIWTDGRFTYCFTNNKGEIVRPENVGYKVLFVNDCHAKLIKDKDKHDVYCNPVEFNWSNEPLPTEQIIDS